MLLLILSKNIAYKHFTPNFGANLDFYAANINAQYQFTLNSRFKIVSFQAVIPTIQLCEKPDSTVFSNFYLHYLAARKFATKEAKNKHRHLWSKASGLRYQDNRNTSLLVSIKVIAGGGAGTGIKFSILSYTSCLILESQIPLILISS